MHIVPYSDSNDTKNHNNQNKDFNEEYMISTVISTDLTSKHHHSGLVNTHHQC